MKKIFSSPDTAEVELIKNMLSDAGIECEVRNGDVARIVPAPPFYEELWVSEEAYGKARELLDSWRQDSGTSGSAWTCPKCGERVEGQFSSCWRCGTPRAQLA